MNSTFANTDRGNVLCLMSNMNQGLHSLFFFFRFGNNFHYNVAFALCLAGLKVFASYTKFDTKFSTWRHFPWKGYKLVPDYFFKSINR